MISLVILNWRRPRNVEHVVARYRRYNMISEIFVVCNAGLPVSFTDGANLPITVKSSADLGLYSRFAIAALAQNNCVLHVDDDLLIPESTINELHKHWRRETDRCYGLHGRLGNGAYDMQNVYGNVEVVLTRCLMTSRTNCSRALTHVHAIDEPSAVPRGNGEDIILSFTAMMYSGCRNRAFQLPYTDFDEGSELEGVALSIHRRWARHVAHRTEILRRCRDHFGIPVTLPLRGLTQMSIRTALRRSAARLCERTQLPRDARASLNEPTPHSLYGANL